MGYSRVEPEKTWPPIKFTGFKPYGALTVG